MRSDQVRSGQVQSVHNTLHIISQHISPLHSSVPPPPATLTDSRKASGGRRAPPDALLARSGGDISSLDVAGQDNPGEITCTFMSISASPDPLAATRASTREHTRTHTHTHTHTQTPRESRLWLRRGAGGVSRVLRLRALQISTSIQGSHVRPVIHMAH